jgi:hypothetical protein
MCRQIGTALLVGVMAIGMLALAPSTAHAQRVWVFNQMDTPLKPCFRIGKNPWLDFGGIGAQGQFAWDGFLQLAKDHLGADPAATEVLVRFTWVESGPGAACPALGEEPNGKTNFPVDGVTPVYIHAGGTEEIRRVGVGPRIPKPEEVKQQ